MKLFCFDIDGTLQTSQKEITHKTKEALSHIKDQGDNFIIATGRHISTCFDILHHVRPDYIVSSGGAAVYKLEPTTEVLKISKLAKNITKKIFEYSKLNNYRLLVFTSTGIYLLENNDNSELSEYDSDILKFEKWDELSNKIKEDEMKEIIKLVLIVNDDKNKEISKILEKQFGDNINVAATPGGFIDINNFDDDKIHGINLIKNLTLSKQIITFGDSMNDFQMTIKADIGIAMGNAYEELKQVADFIVQSNDDEGIHEGVMKVYD